jgi:Phage tail tube protein
MSDTNRVSVSFKEESTFGTYVTANPDFQELRYTGESLHQEQDTVTSQEIRSDRQISDIIRTGIRGAGDLNFELSYGAYDTFFKQALLADADFGALVTVEAASAVISVDAVGVITTTGTWDVTPTVGRWIEIRGFATAGNNGFARVTSATTNTITTAGHAFAAEAAGASVLITQGGIIRNGTTFYSNNIEKKYTDLTTTFAQLAGMAIDRFTLNVPTSGVITGTFGFIGKQERSATTTLGDGTNTAATTNDVMAGVDDVEAIVEGVIADSDAYSATAFTMELSNNLRARLQIGTLGAISIGTGTCEIRGTLQAYFTSSTVMDKFLSDTQSSLAIEFEDNAGNTYIIDLPAIKYSAGQRNATGINQDVIADLSWSSKMHATLGYTIQISRFAA